ncbi:MAG TPA: glycosyltransferase family 39 protein [Thermomicrobiaceae bacterium]|nr:glycosyltransferase family 39 protein [Thermomicrobiaceae bacterium]
MVATTPETAAEAGTPSIRDAWWRRSSREGEATVAWERAALAALLGLTALLYLWNLGASGWANAFYAAAVQAGTQSWKAFFFGSFDAANFISVDKPPAALWVMELSARLFGVNAWSILVPQALEGVAAVGLLYATVRRWFSPAAALLAGAVMALTPVAALMFRFNNPDALLVLLLVAGAYAMTRAIESGSTRWLLLMAGLIGLGFITKMLQAFLVVPPFALVYLVAAPGSLRRRLGQLLVAGVAGVVSAGWWVAAVMLTPASARPYVGGSQDNSILNLVFGYNGFGRITGNETGSVGGAPGIGGGRWGPTGLVRLFEAEMGGQISWLLPAALLAVGVLLWLSRRAPRTDRLRAATLLWGGWLLVTGVIFSEAAGIIHPYYTVALAPAIGALVGIGAASLWERRDRLIARFLLAAGVAGTAAWAYVLLDRTPSWYPLLRESVLVLGLGAGLALLVAGRLRRQTMAAVVVVALVAILAGPAAYAAQTAATPHTGAIPSAGPTIAGAGGLGGPGPRGFAPGANGRPALRGGFPGGAPRTGSPFGLPGTASTGAAGTGNPFARSGGFGGGAPGTAGPHGGLGGLLNADTPSAALVSLLEQNSGRYTWVAATVGANNAAGVQLATGDPVMAIGGFNGTDPAPTLAQFEQDVQAGRIHYFLASGGFGGFGGPGGGSGTGSQITGWVEQHFTATTVGGVTVYDLTTPASGN